MRYRGWGSHYNNGDLVLSHIDNKPQVLLVMSNSGDYFHTFMAVKVGWNENSPSNHDHIIAEPERRYSGYWVGPSVGHLSDEQVVSLGTGIDVPQLTATVSVSQVLLTAERSPRLSEPRRAG